MLKPTLFLGKNGLSLQRRSFTFFLLFLSAVMLGLLLILFSTGAFSVGVNECHLFLRNELKHIAGDVAREFGVLSVEGVALAKRLTEQIESRLQADGLSPSQLKNHPHLLEPILSESVELLVAALEKNKSSGAFLVLDATVNPALDTAETSRAGLFLKNMEPNVINLAFPAIRFLRGPASIARQKHLHLLPQWQMEFQVEPGDFFFTTINAAKGSDLPLSRLYYWNPSSTLAGNYEKAMLLCVPLITSDGFIVGVCGFEVSAMLFKLQNTPANSTYTRAFTMLAPVQGNALDASKAMYAGNYSAIPLQSGGTLSIKALDKGISSYSASNGSAYSGLHQKINIYPKDAAFSGDEWVLAILIPERDLVVNIREQNRRFLILLLMLLIFSVGAASLISRRQMAPVVGALQMVKNGQVSTYEKTNIQEIDDLIAFLAARDTSDSPSLGTEEVTINSTLFQNFVKNIETLSPAERAVFNLYMKGYTAKEIAEILCLSINTIKTHNKRIYAKLNVTSRKELLLYVQLIQEQEGAAPQE
ncbi:MAG: hypothetical protein GX050_03150 [Firmicutes bacterium]|nr:hypothetical protein [Bacillota bacterium]